jgi:2-isopropylmalate synthase
MKATELGLPVAKGSPEVAEVLRDVKRLEHEGYEFEAAEASFELLLRRFLGKHRQLFELVEYRCDFVRSGVPGEEWNKCVAGVKIRINGEDVHKQGGGDGPVNALDAALRAALSPHYPVVCSVRLEDYKVRIINGRLGTAARTRVLISSTDGNALWDTVGVSDNIIEASWQALVDSYDYAVLQAGRET